MLDSRGKSSKNSVADNVAVPSEAFMTEFQDFSFANTISNIEGQVKEAEDSDVGDDVLPGAAAEMGAGQDLLPIWLFIIRAYNNMGVKLWVLFVKMIEDLWQQFTGVLI